MILLSARLYHPVQGGSVRFVDEMASAYIKNGWPVTIMTRTAGDHEEDAGRPCSVVRRPSFLARCRLTAAATATHQVETSLQDALPALLLRKPLIITHQQPFEKRQGWPRLVDLAQKRLQHLAVAVSVGPGVDRSWGGGGIVIPNPYDPEVFFEDGQGARPIDFLFAGRLYPGKGVLLFLEALRSLAGSFRRAVILGDGPLRKEIHRDLADSELGESVELHPWQPPEAVAHLMRETKIMVLPSYEREGLPLSLVEAIACGCVPVTTRVNAIDEFFGDSCQYVPPQDAGALAAVMEKTLGDFSAIRQRRAAAREKITSECALPAVAARYRALLASRFSVS